MKLMINILLIVGLASYYGVEACQYNPDPKCPMANGISLYEAINNKVPYAAMWGVPFGQRVRVTNLATGASTVAVVADRGPARGLSGRIIDLNKESFAQIENPERGLVKVKVEVLK